MPVDLTVDQGIATVVLNRPEAMNSIDPEMRKQVHETWRRIREDDEILVAIITGAGERAFSTGADLKKTMPPGHSFARQYFWIGDDHLNEALITIYKPLVAAINGFAVGGGLELALACDIRIAADTAQFGFGEVRVGAIPGAAGTLRLPRAISSAVAMKMLLTGERIGAQEALRVGLVSDVVPLAELMPLARELAGRIRDNAPLAVRAIKMLAQRARDIPLEHAIVLERMVWGVMRDTEDRIEGRRAFAEKRKPVYRGL